MNHIFVTLLVILALYTDIGLTKPICPKNTVAFQNSLFTSHSVLKVHCKSRDNDLGEHLLNFQSPSYNFSFRDNLVVTTEFKCDLWKGANFEYHQNILAYEGAPIYRCGALYAWDARDDAIYLSKDHKAEELKYSWIK